MLDEKILIDAKFDKNTTVSDFIKQHKDTLADYYDLVVNDQVISKNTAMRDAIVVKFQERQVKFTVSYSTGSIPIEFGLTKTIKSLKEHLRKFEEIPVDQHTLILKGKILSDDALIKDCKIVDGSVVHIKQKTVFDLIKFLKHENADDYDLAVDGKVVSRTMTLHEAGISETSKFEIRDRKSRILVYIKNSNSRNFQVHCYPTDTILNFKEYIVESQGVPIRLQSITFKEKHLFDEATLIECGIINGSEVYFRLRLLSCGDCRDHHNS